MATKAYTTAEAAKEIGVSRQTLFAWIGTKKIKAPKPIKLGSKSVRIWTRADIERAKKFKGTLKRGPKPK